MITNEIFPNEPIRYTDEARRFYNNGFRRRWLASGALHAKAINAARAGDFISVMAHGHTLGGLGQIKGWAKSAIASARKLSDDLPDYKIENGVVWVPNLSWSWRGSRQVAEIAWSPMFGRSREATRFVAH